MLIRSTPSSVQLHDFFVAILFMAIQDATVGAQVHIIFTFSQNEKQKNSYENQFCQFFLTIWQAFGRSLVTNLPKLAEL